VSWRGLKANIPEVDDWRDVLKAHDLDADGNGLALG
jgi:hypothetical protein